MAFIAYVSDVAHVPRVELSKNEVNNSYYVADYNWSDAFYIIDRPHSRL